MTADELACKTIRLHIHHKRISEGERYRHLKPTERIKERLRVSARQTDRNGDGERQKDRNAEGQALRERQRMI